MKTYPSLLVLILIASGINATAADTGTAPAPDQPLLRVSTVGHNGMPKNIVPKGAEWNFGPGSLWTHRGWQYAAYWDDERQVSVARRRLPDGEWLVASLPGYQRTENTNRGVAGPIARGFGDSHEKVSMGISPDGVIHLAFDHHVSTLHYRTSKLPVANDPAAHAWTADLFGPVRDNLGGPKIASVTYPGFSSDGKDFVLYLRLNGGSGSADSHIFSYGGGRWNVNTEPASKLIDKRWSGGDKTVNAYPHGLVMHNGRWHLTWCWRDTPDAKTCHDLCYAYSDDQGKTWRTNDGQEVARTGDKSITANSPGISVWEIPTGTRYVNGGSMAVDHVGRVHVLMRGERGSQVHFQRDPANGKWTRQNSSASGSLIVGQSGELLVVSEEGLMRLPAGPDGKVETIIEGRAALFKDSHMGVDKTRMAHDGWVSVIGQTGKTVSVVDYRIRAAVLPR